jgi:hypothetical protein
MSTAMSVTCPFTLVVEPMARLANCELADDPTYDGLELQWFDDAEHGTGLLVLLTRRADRRVDVYVDPALTVDPARFAIGAGLGTWTPTVFDVGRLEVAEDGVDAELRFRDREGRSIEVRWHDRDGRRRRRGRLLAPVGSGIEAPRSLLLVHLHGFDLLRRGGRLAPEVRIDGRAASTGVLPGRALHRRELVKYASPVEIITLNEASDGGSLPRLDPGSVRLADGGVGAVVAGTGAQRVRLELRPALPDLTTLADGAGAVGSWRVYPEGAPPLTGGTWMAIRRGDEVRVGLEVTERWRPGRLPPLIALVTRVVPVFRRWPTTYRWRATITVGGEPTMVSRWERTGDHDDDSYLRATGSASRAGADRS